MNDRYLWVEARAATVDGLLSIVYESAATHTREAAPNALVEVSTFPSGAFLCCTLGVAICSQTLDHRHVRRRGGVWQPTSRAS